MSVGNWTITQFSLPHPPNQDLRTWAMGCTPARVSRIAHIDYRSTAHPSIAGYSLPSSRGMAVPTVSPQSATLPLHIDPFSPLPTLPYDRRLSSRWMLGSAHLLSLVPFLSPDSHTAPMTLCAPAEGFRLPDLHPPPSYEERELASTDLLNLTCVLTIHDIVWQQYNRHDIQPDSLYPDIPPIGRVTVSGSVIIDRIHLLTVLCRASPYLRPPLPLQSLPRPVPDGPDNPRGRGEGTTPSSGARSSPTQTETTGTRLSSGSGPSSMGSLVPHTVSITDNPPGG